MWVLLTRKPCFYTFMVEAYGRSINSRKEKLEYEPYQIREHETRENCKISTPYMGYRFRLHRTDLPGKPDIVLPKYKIAIFVHGCFWHRHAGCKNATMPKTNTDFWEKKFSKNVAATEQNCSILLPPSLPLPLSPPSPPPSSSLPLSLPPSSPLPPTPPFPYGLP